MSLGSCGGARYAPVPRVQGLRGFDRERPICYDLTWGWQPQQIADDIHAHLDAKGVTLLDVGTMVNAAHSIYCPGNVCDAPTLCT